MSRKASNPLAAGKFTHQQWNPAYLAAKAAIYPKGADEGDLDIYLATERASNPTEEDPDAEGSEQAAGSSKFGSKSCGQGRFKRQKKQ
jgi:hypothetical protein